MTPLASLYLLLFFFLPISVEQVNHGIGMVLPAEPIEVVILLILVYRWRRCRFVLKPYFQHPLFIALTAFAFWNWVACLPSDNWIVAVKYAVIETLHYLVFVVGLLVVWHDCKITLADIIVAYSISFFALLLRGWILAAKLNFVLSFSIAALWPFYNDHTLYGACATILFFCWIYLIRSEARFLNRYPLYKIGYAALVILLIGIVTSNSRGAWLSLLFGITGLLLFACWKLQRTIFPFVFMIGIAIGLGGLLRLGMLAQSPDYVKNISISQQFISTFNWTYEVANLERINRYKCAIRMIKERPLIGFGNNGYKFHFTQYQRKEDLTRLSVIDNISTCHKGIGGNSHCEYLEIWVNQGLIGLCLWLTIILLSFGTCLTAYTQNHQKTIGYLALALLSFYLAVLVNNFLHDNKSASLVWSILAALVYNNNSSINHHSPQ